MGKKNKTNKKNSSNEMFQKDSEFDERFKDMFTDEDFNLKYVTNKKGLPIHHTSSKDMKNYYSVATSESESEGENEQSDDAHLITQKSRRTKDSEEKESCSSESSDDEEESNVKPEAADETSSDTGEDAEVDLDDGFDHKWEELDANAPVASEITRRLALCNMDWDRIRADDILAVFNSFKPANGIIYSVKIFPSDYGMKRMEEEKINGPAELVERTLGLDGGNAKEEKEGSKYHREKLRQYQLNRLKYYYAVIECDLPETADSLYTQLNGMEYESSGVSIDLRFIPDDMTFDQEPKYTASAALNPNEYKPRLFANSALQQVKVNLTWDETDPKRRETIRRAFTDPDSVEQDIKNYLASSSGSEEDEEENASSNNRAMKLQERISKYKDLLKSIEDEEKQKENKFGMEISWDPDLKEKTTEMVKEKIEKETFTPFEEKLKKKKEETKQRKKERKMLLKKEAAASSGSELEDEIDQSSDEQLNDFSSKSAKFQGGAGKNDSEVTGELSLLVSESNEETLARTQRKTRKELRKQKMKEKRKQRMKEKEAEAESDIDDPRFSEMYTSHEFNVDPSDPHFKDSKSIGKMRKKEKKRKMNEEMENPSKQLSKNELFERIYIKKSKKDHSRKHHETFDDVDII